MCADVKYVVVCLFLCVLEEGQSRNVATCVWRCLALQALP